MQKNIRNSWFFEYTPEQLWECLTDSELIAQWRMKNDFKPVVGHRFRFHAKGRPGFGWDGIA